MSADRRDWHLHRSHTVLTFCAASTPSHVQSARPEWLKVSSLEVLQPGGDATLEQGHGAGLCATAPDFSAWASSEEGGLDSQVLVAAGQEIRLPYVLSFSLYSSF